MKKFFLTSFFAISLLSSCENEKVQEAKKLNQQIMVVHDEVMPKLGELNSLKQHVKQYSQITSPENAALKDSLIQGILVLTEADEAMMNWMAQYEYPNPKLNDEEILKYLTAQKDSVKQMSDKIYMAMAIGHQLLKNAPNSLKLIKK